MNAIFNDFGRVAGDHSAGRNILRNNGTSGDNGSVANCHILKNDGSHSDPDMVADPDGALSGLPTIV